MAGRLVGKRGRPGKSQRVRTPLILIGAVAVVTGCFLTLAGLNVLGGTRMSGDNTWAIVGPVVAVVGMLVLLFGFRPPDTG